MKFLRSEKGYGRGDRIQNVTIRQKLNIQLALQSEMYEER